MSELPSIEQVLAAIDSLPAEWTMPAGPNKGLKFVSRGALAGALFNQGSPLWRRPKGQPHGRNNSPAWDFMERLGFKPEITVTRIKGIPYFARKPE